MSTVAFIRRCMVAGMDLETALLAAEQFEAVPQPMTPAVTTRQERNRRYYENKKGAKSSESVLIKTVKTHSDVSDASKTHSDASKTVSDAAPRAHVRDNNPKLVNIPNLTTPDCECVWPETDPPSRPDLDRLEVALRQAAGAALNPTAPRLFDLSPILRLARQGQGPPCDLQADVLPTIRARSARAPPGSVKSWDFFRDAITEARDRRLSGAPASEPRHERNQPHQGPSTARSDRLGRSLAGLMAAVDEREDQLGGRRSGTGG